MHSLQRTLLLLILTITCTFSTGFLSSNESPEDAIKAVITAIENNDAAAFNERVTTGYWKSFFSDYGQNHNDVDYVWLKDLIANAESMNALKKLHLNRATLSSAILYTLPTSIAELITKGDFANYCRKYKSLTLPFDPSILKKLTYGDEGKDAYEGISSAVATMLDGQESVLGFAKIDEKWYIVSNAGNRKAALDKAVAARKILQEKAKRIAERKKNNEKYIKAVAPQIKVLHTLLGEKKWHQLAQESQELYGLFYSQLKKVTNNASYNSKSFWDNVYHGIVKNIYNEKNAKDFIVKREAGIKKSKAYHLSLEHFPNFETSEIIWESDNIILVKEYTPKASRDTLDKFKASYNDWINYDTQAKERFFFYYIMCKENGAWQTKAHSAALFKPFNDSNQAYTEYYPFLERTNNIPISVEQYMLELAKRFEGMYTKAKVQVANEEKWTKEIQDTFTALNKAITNNKPETFIKHMDIATFLRDRGSLEQVAMAIAKNQGHDTDVNFFLAYVTLGDWHKDTPAKDGFRDFQIYSVTELQAIALDKKGTHILLERKDARSPWKIIREGSKNSILNRPKDWNAKLAAQVKIYAVQVKLEQSLKNDMSALGKATKNQNSELFKQYVDLPFFLYDNGNLEETAIKLADNEKEKFDVKKYLANIATFKLSAYYLLSVQDVIELSQTRAIIHGTIATLEGTKHIRVFILLERKDASAHWKLIRYAKHEKDLARPKNWLADVTARSKAILEERAKEEARKQKALVAMQKKMQAVSAGMTKAVTEKDVMAFFKYVDVSTLFIKLANTFDSKAYRTIIHTQLAPLRPLEQKIKHALTAQKPLEDLAIIWDADAWNKASYTFLDDTEKNVLATIPSKNGNYYALFTPFQSSYKLILAPTKDKITLEKEGNDIARMWSEVLANYALDTTRKELLQFVDLLQQKKGKELIEHVNIPTLVSWKDAQDPKNGVEKQVFATLFAQDSYNKPRIDVAKNATSMGLLHYGNLDMSASAFEVSTLYALTPNIVIIQGNKNCLLFVKKDSKFYLEAIAGDLTDVQRGQFKDNYLTREKLLVEEQETVLHSVAMQSTSNAALDLLQVTGGSYEVFKSPQGNMQLRVKATVKNTYDKPITPLKFMMYFTDTEGHGWQPWVTSITSEEFKPHQSKDFDWEFFPSEKEAYLLQQVQAGKMYLMVRTAEATINKKIYKRFGTMVDPKQLPNGFWQLENFAPVQPLPQWTSAPENVQKALWDGMKKNPTALTTHSGRINTAAQLTTTPVEPKLSEAEKKAIPVQSPQTAETSKAAKPDVVAQALRNARQAKMLTDQENKTAESSVAKPQTPQPVPTVTPIATPKAAPVTTVQPTAPAPKKPGKAVIVPITTDTMSLTAFAPDKKPDSSIRVLAQGKSPLIAVRVESMGGSGASWKTKDVKTKAQGVLAVMQDGKLINASDASFSIDVDTPVSLDLVMQDKGVIADAKARLRVIFFHKDGSRTYSIVQR